jgi:hypothetical protein
VGSPDEPRERGAHGGSRAAGKRGHGDRAQHGAAGPDHREAADHAG